MRFEEEFFEKLNQPLNAMVLRRIFLLLTRFHFCDPENYGGLKEMIGDILYSEDDKLKTLDVELLHVFDPKQVNPRPGVFVGFRPFQFHKVGVNNYAGVSGDNSAEYFVMPTDATLHLHHVAATADMASLLADASVAFFFGIRTMLMERLSLRQLDIVALSEPRPVEKAPERAFDVTLECQLNFNYTMTTNIESHRIKKIAATLNPVH